MATIEEVDVPRLALDRLDGVVSAERMDALRAAAVAVSSAFAGRSLWNVNSTASGGGVAEMLHVLVGYARDAGVDARWLVIEGDAEFFALTKRIHNNLHGFAGDGGPLGALEAAHYSQVLAGNATALLERVRPGDAVLLHDPQTAGLVPALAAAGAGVVWRCHIGADVGNEHTERAWAFLRPYLAAAQALVFSRARYVPDWVAPGEATIIPPSIDPFSPKNQDLGPATAQGILARAGIVAPDGTDPLPTFTCPDGSIGNVVRSAVVVRSGPPPHAATPVVVQVSRWDRLKDMAGVMRGFAQHVGRHDAHLVLAGPAVAGVSDDPEGAAVLEECVDAWRRLPPAVQARIHLACLPMDDLNENAAMVNALQRHAAVVVQKSLAEGFGLTVAEAMWKARPVVASDVGGIADQVTPDTGVLVHDPTDLRRFGLAVTRLLDEPEEAARVGAAARQRVRENFLADRHLLQYADLFGRLLGRAAGP